MDMNLANKLTMLRVVMIPAFLLVLFLAPEPMNRYIAVIYFYRGILNGYAGWQDCKKIQHGFQLREIYGPSCGQAVGDVCIGFHGCFKGLGGMGRYRDFGKRICHYRLPYSCRWRRIS